MKFKILIVIALMIVSFFAGYYFAPSDSGEVENAGAICTNGVFLDSVQCECPDGYTKTGVPFPPSGTGNYVYCKVDMNWEDFESCDSADDCSAGYSCLSEDTVNLEYRCVPDFGHIMNCFCELSGACVCA